MNAILWAALSNAVQATLVALLVALLARWIKRPGLVHALWLLVFFKLLTPPLVGVPLPAIAERNQDQSFAASLPSLPIYNVLDPAPAPSSFDSPERLSDEWSLVSGEKPVVSYDSPFITHQSRLSGQLTLVSLWLAGSLGWSALAGWRIVRFGRVLRRARPAPPEVQEQARRLARRLGLARLPGIWLVPGPAAPLLWAVGRTPQVIVPGELWQRLTAAQRDTLLLHELAHLARGDHWVRRLELIVLGIYWWHPLAWWTRRRLREAEEQCCDACVVATLPGSAPAYAEAIVKTVTFLSQPHPVLPVGATGLGQLHRLQRRLTMILHGSFPPALSRRGLGTVLGLGTLVVALVPTLVRSQQPGQARQAPAANAGKQASQAADLGEARARLKKSQDDLEAQRARYQRAQAATKEAQEGLSAAEEQLKQAQARVDALTAKPKVVVNQPFNPLQVADTTADWNIQPGQWQNYTLPQANTWNAQPGQWLHYTLPQANPLNINTVWDANAVRLQATNGVQWALVPLQIPTPEPRLQELERRLDTLQREVQELKRQLRTAGSRSDP